MKEWLGLVARVVVGSVWIYAGASKLADPAQSVAAVRAYQLLPGNLAQPVGQLLPVQTFGGAEFRHFYNVTNLVRCVDVERSAKDETGFMEAEVFYDIHVPREPAVFKDPATAGYRIYTNDPGRELLEKLAAEAGLTGLECGEPRNY